MYLKSKINKIDILFLIAIFISIFIYLELAILIAIFSFLYKNTFVNVLVLLFISAIYDILYMQNKMQIPIALSAVSLIIASKYILNFLFRRFFRI